MVRALTHRGPDEEGYYEDGDISMGMRRLSIVDVSGGSQPIYNEDKTIVVILNGEIYNYKNLQTELEKKGHRFATKTDTEAIAHLYEEKGEDFVRLLDGMFTLAVWDIKKKKLILARDRFGKKPLFYSQAGGKFFFGSEIKSILAGADIVRKVNFEALHHYLSLKHIPQPLTIYENIFSLPPATLMVYEDGKSVMKNYWQLKYDGAEEKDETVIVTDLEKLLSEAVEKRMIGDVPIGAYLSGGVDSSLVTAMYSQMAPGKIKTFCLKYKNGSAGKNADAHFARLVAEKYNTEHYEYEMEDGEIFDDLENILTAFDEPFAGVVSTYFISKLIKQHVKVAVSGDGADELFASYLAPRLSYVNRHTDNLGVCAQDAPFWEKIKETDDWKWRSKLVVFSEAEKKKIYSVELLNEFKNHNTEDLYKKYFSHTLARDPLNRVLDVDRRVILEDEVLPFVDRLSMAHSIEVRCPFLDCAFTEYAANLSGDWKIRAGETKYILKKMAEKYLPKDLIYRPKEGFISPINQWLGNHKDYISSILSPANLSRHGFFNADEINRLVAEMKSEDSKSVNKIWVLINFQVWFNKFMV